MLNREGPASRDRKEQSYNWLDGPTLACLQGAMNHKRGVIALIVVFVFIFFFGFVWHDILMKSAYMETAALWRAPGDFKSYFWVLILGHVVMAFAFTGLNREQGWDAERRDGFWLWDCVWDFLFRHRSDAVRGRAAHEQDSLDVDRGQFDLLRDRRRIGRRDL